MTIEPIAYFRSPLTSKFGIPRQSGVVATLPGRIEFAENYRNADALRGIEDFDFLWLIWGFSENVGARKHLLVRPPRLGGNRYMGVFATRSPFRPNNLGLSSVRLVAVADGGAAGPVLCVEGADLMDGTPIYDIKPYLPLTDCHADARGGFTDTCGWRLLTVEIGAEWRGMFTADELLTLEKVLSQDPRPAYHDDPCRIYGMPFAGRDVRFCVADGVLRVVGVDKPAG